MSDPVLSTEEVDAIMKAAEPAQHDLGSLISSAREQGNRYCAALNHIYEQTRVESERNFSAFFRKKIIARLNTSNLITLSVALSQTDKPLFYHVFRILPQDRYGVFVLDGNFVHQTINLLYGGKINPQETVPANPGKIGLMVAEKLCEMALQSFEKACTELSKIQCSILKTSLQPQFPVNVGINGNDEVFQFEFGITLDELETSMRFLVAEPFFNALIPEKTDIVKDAEKSTWHTAIQSQVSDSTVSVQAALPEITMRAKDFMALKPGDIIPITDPTSVHLCVNSLKLFRAIAGQANGKRVVKILGQFKD